MARMLGIHASGIRGSIGGNTFTANQYHQIVIRQRTAPVQPQSNARDLIRSAFGGAVGAWNAATDAQRTNWNQYAETVVRNGPLGTYRPSGRNLAVGQYAVTNYLNDVASLDLGMLPSMDAPEKAGALVFDTLTIGPPEGVGIGFNVKAQNDNGESGYVYAVRSLQTADSRRYWSGPFDPDTTQAELVADEDASSIDFLNLVDGGVYFVKVNLISSAVKRRMAQPFILRAVASETTV